MINRHRFRQLIAPTAGIRKSVAVALLGLGFFLVGLALSFRLLIGPAFSSLSDWWNSILSQAVPKDQIDLANHWLGLVLLLVGFYLLFQGVRGSLRRINEILNPGIKGGMAKTFLRRQQLAQGVRIVAIGGGTGLSTLLKGLKQYTSNITAIVTVTDDGGSSGRLVRDMGIIPPGDLRNCLVALADQEKLMTDLFQHRFKTEAGSLSGHSIGNLLIAALVEQEGGDFDKALTRASEVLNIRGRVIPSTLTPVRLRALLENGAEVCGETNIVSSGARIRRIFLDPEHAEPHPDALEALAEADLIVIGPGSVYTSLVPNLLISGITEAIQSSRAAKAYICNVMTQPGESDAFTAAEHLVALQANIDGRVIDYALVNTGVPSPAAIEKYEQSGQHLVQADLDRIKAMGIKPVTGDYMSESDYVRHDPMKLAARLLGLLNR
ncbi:MAG TPA: YvcK family protein [Fimbriimonadaceae bacterium]|nr:YvcK family protein [Fimbriimonadaceae bacterium]HRJ32507.1 YvcK family protein [Fimbriimonadaceae bacterium]